MALTSEQARHAELTITRLETRLGTLLDSDVHDGLSKAESILQEVRTFVDRVEEADKMQADGTRVDASYAPSDMRLEARERLLRFLLGRETIHPTKA